MRCRLTFLLIGLLPTAAFAAADWDDPTVMVALENRDFRMRHELTVAGGVLPLDAFYKGITAQVEYTYHFNDYLGWEAGRFTISHNFPTSLETQVSRDFGLKAAGVQEVSWIAGSDLVLTPLYGKFAVMGANVIHVEFMLLGGASGVMANGAISPAANLGGGFRVFLARSFSVKVEVTNDFVFGSHTFNVLGIALGAAFNMGGN